MPIWAPAPTPWLPLTGRQPLWGRQSQLGPSLASDGTPIAHHTQVTARSRATDLPTHTAPNPRPATSPSQSLEARGLLVISLLKL